MAGVPRQCPGGGHDNRLFEAAGTKDYRGVQANVGEVIAWRNLFLALSDAVLRDPKPWIGDYLLAIMDRGNAYAINANGSGW
jgi:4-hydroxyphenylacetate 3-monooxygenase